MKFIYHGMPAKNVDLVWAGIFKPQDILVEGTIFEVPDENIQLIRRCMVNGCFEKYVEPKKTYASKITKSKKNKQKKEEKVKEE